MKKLKVWFDGNNRARVLLPDGEELSRVLDAKVEITPSGTVLSLRVAAFEIEVDRRLEMQSIGLQPSDYLLDKH